MSRTFVITGGAKGIGRCMVEYFASKGDKVYFIDNENYDCGEQPASW